MSKPNIYNVIATDTTEPRDIRDRFSDAINVKDFGAVGDGEHDDTDALQSALSKGTEIGKGVVIPSGTYKISRIMTYEKGNPLNIRALGHVVIHSTAETHATQYEDYALGFSGTSKVYQKEYNHEILEGARQIPRDSLDVEAGDLIVLASNQLVQGESRSSWTRGGVYKVASVDDDTIYLCVPVHTHYAAPTTFDITVTEQIDTKSCKFGNVDADHFDMMYKITAKTGANVGAEVSFRWITDWDNTTKIATFHTSSAATGNSNGTKLWSYPSAVGDVFTLEKTLKISVFRPIEVHIEGDLHITRDPVYDRKSDYFAGLQIQYSTDSTVDGITVSNFVYANIRAHESYRPVFRNCKSLNCNSSDTGYGYTTSGCFEPIITHCYAYGCRSGYSCGNAGCQDCFGVIENFTVRASPRFINSSGIEDKDWPRGYGYSGHGNAFKMLYRNNISFDVQQVSSYRDYMSTYENCVGYGASEVFLYAQRYCGLSCRNCRLYAYGNENSSTRFIQIHDRYDKTEKTIVEGCVASGLRNSFVYCENSDIIYSNLRIVGNSAYFSKDTGILTGISGPAVPTLGEDNQIYGNSCHYTKDFAKSERHGFFMPRHWCQVADNTPIQIGPNKWYVRITARARIELPIVETSGCGYLVNLLTDYNEAYNAVGMILYQNTDEEDGSLPWSAGDFSPTAFNNKGSKIHVINSTMQTTEGKMNLRLSRGLIIDNRTDDSTFSIISIEAIM